MIAKTLDLTDARLILGSHYFDHICATCGWEKSHLVALFSQFLENKEALSQNEQHFFAFLAELVELQFTLYKWGMILYNDENGLCTPVMMEFGEPSNPWNIVKNTQSPNLILYDKELTASFKTSTSLPLVEALLFLYEKDIITIRLVPADVHQIASSATIVALDTPSQGENYLLNNVKHEFEKQKKRLEELQTLFNQNF